jgi:hypothetical protein
MKNKLYDYVLFTDGAENGLIHKPIGAFKLANQIRRLGYSCLVIDHLGKFKLNELKQFIDLSIDISTRMVGFSNTFIKTDSDITITHDPVQDGLFFPQGIEFQNEILSYIKYKNKFYYGKKERKKRI